MTKENNKNAENGASIRFNNTTSKKEKKILTNMAVITYCRWKKSNDLSIHSDLE
jgi:hypothetical protein